MNLPAPPAGRLPDGFAVGLDPRTRRLDDGATLLGGSPLRMLRLSARARTLLTQDRLVVRDATTAELAARLLDTGAASPDLAPAPAPDVTVVIPVRDRPAALERLLPALRADPATAAVPIVVVDDGSIDAAAVRALADAAGADVLRHEISRGPAAARNAGLRTATTDAVAFLDSDCVPRAGWLEALAPHLADPRLAVVAPRIVAWEGDGSWLSRYEDVAGALDMGARPAAVRPLSAVSYVPSAALLCRRSALGDGFDETMRVAEDVDLVWRLAAAGWRIRYEPTAAVAHEHRTAPREWMRRRAFYGTGAALLAARHGSAVAPVILAPSSALVWLLAGAGAGRPGRLGALALLGWTTTRLARRLRRPGEPAPVILPAQLVMRGTAAAGRSLTRAATRHWWPVALLAAAVSRRARRWLLAVAIADGVDAWWPHRHQAGPVRFIAARRLEDVAYGAGLWWGALRHRQPRALLPARPPRME